MNKILSIFKRLRNLENENLDLKLQLEQMNERMDFLYYSLAQLKSQIIKEKQQDKYFDE